jgi:hypothetical protein
MSDRELAIDAIQVFIMKNHDLFNDATIVEHETENNVWFTSTANDGRQVRIGYTKAAP